MSQGGPTNPWAIAIVVALAAFMEVLDTSIANVALPYIAGSLSATADQSTWVLTSYLVSNAIVLPLTGWFVSVVGRKRLFVICLTIFTVSSLLCGIAPSLGTMIFFRILQGAGGGGLQPMAQAILADTFPPQQRGMAFAVFGVTVIVAPVLGPTLGGWITDNFDWRWIFFINLPIGIATVLLISRLIKDPPWQVHRANRSIRVDYVGMSLLVLGVGALQVMLDKGQELDWFGSGLIVWLAVLAAVGLTALFVWEWFHDEPVIDVRLFQNRNFLSANIMMFAAGVVMFSGLVMMPQYLQLLMGYSSESAGLVLSGGGLLLVVMMPLSGILASRVPARYLVTAGWCITCAGMFYTITHLDPDISFRDAALLRVVQVAGLPLLFVPIVMISYVGTAPEKSNSVAGLISFMRNIGSGIGTSLVTTMVAQRAQFHHAHLVEHTRAGDPAFTAMVAGLSTQLATRGADLSRATMQAYDSIYRAVIAQATALAYIDVFWVLAVGAAIMAPLSLTLRRNDPRAGATQAVH